MTDITPPANASMTLQVATLSSSLAQALINAATDASVTVGKNMTIAVVDVAGNLKAFSRMDGSPLLSTDIAQNKAYTAAAFGMPTDQWFNFIEHDEPLRAGIVHTPRLVVYGGGFPVVVDGDVVGGIGVSGGHYTDDMSVARSAMAAVGLLSDDGQS